MQLKIFNKELFLPGIVLGVVERVEEDTLPLPGSQPCLDEGACLTQCSCEPRHAGSPKTDKS